MSPGQAGDAPRGRQLLRELGPLADHDLLPEEPALVMDRACEGDETRKLATELGFQVVVPPRSDRRAPWDYDRERYKRRNEVERLFRRLKGFRRVHPLRQAGRDVLGLHRLRPHRGSPQGSVNTSCREAHYCKVLLDEIFGRASFMNEIIWAYDYGARSKRKWSAKHDTIFWYAKDPNAYTFNFDVMDRIPYMAPGLVGKEKAARGKTPTDVWWHIIVSPNGREKTGYPTQKPLGILERIVKVHSNPGDTVLDFFAGSGTTGEAAHAMAGTTYWLTRIRRRRASWPRAWPTTMWRPSGSTGSIPKRFNGVCLSNMR